MPLAVEQLRAYSFPLRKGPSGYFASSSGKDALDEMIEQVIGTAKGERVMRPTFGCDIHGRVFQPNDTRGNAVASSDIKSALEQWVPGIDLVEVKATPDGHNCDYSVRYRERATRQIRSLNGAVALR